MAFIENQDDEIQTNPQAQAAPLVGGGSAAVGGGGSTGVGKGGQGGWTNIQSYLGANQGNQSAAGALGKEVGGQFDKETNSLNEASGKTKAEADKAADVANPQGQEFQQQYAHYLAGDNSKADPIRNGLTGAYAGPNQFSYGLGADTQNYGNQLRDDGQFNQLLGGMYNKAAGGQMSRGQLALQGQLDSGDEKLAQERQALNARYKGLEDMVGLKSQETQDAITGAQSRYGQNQNLLNAYLNDELGLADEAYKGAIDTAKNPTAKADAKYKYDRIANLLGVLPEEPTGPKETELSGEQKGGDYLPGQEDPFGQTFWDQVSRDYAARRSF